MVSALGLASCGRVWYDARGDAGTDAFSDAGTEGASDGGIDSGADGGPDAGACSWLTGPPAFSAPEHLDGPSLAGAYDGDPVPSADGLVLFFNSSRTGNLDIYSSRRTSRHEELGAPVIQADTEGLFPETRYVRSPDGLEAFFGSSRDGGLGGWDIWHATRPDITAPFGPFAPLPGVSTARDEFDPFVSADGRALYFAPAMFPAGIGGQDLAVSLRAAPGAPFMPPTLLPNVNSPAADTDPSLTADGRVLVFASDRVGGVTRVYYATRATPSDPFDAPSELTALPFGAELHDPYVSPDGCDLYFGADFDTPLEIDLYVLHAGR